MSDLLERSALLEATTPVAVVEAARRVIGGHAFAVLHGPISSSNCTCRIQFLRSSCVALACNISFDYCSSVCVLCSFEDISFVEFHTCTMSLGGGISCVFIPSRKL